MADTPRTQLERAYRLIHQERLDEASALLQPLVKKEPDNADAWWLLANAVTEPEDARTALENVLRLTPNHTEARELLDQLNATVSPMDDFGDVNFDDPFAGLDAKPVTDAPTDLNTLFDDEVPSFVREGGSAAPTGTSKKTIRDFTTEDDEALLAALDAPTTKSPSAVPSPRSSTSARSGSPRAALTGNRRLFLPLAVAAIVALLLIVVVLILPALNPPTPPGTTVASVTTAGPSALPSSAPAAATVAANIAVTAPATAASAVASSAANAPPITAAASANAPVSAQSLAEVSTQTVALLKAAGIDNAQVNVVLTSIGQTLTARFCGPYGPKLDGKVRSGMDVVAAQGAKLSSQIQGVGVEVDSCTDQTQIYAKEIATIQDVMAYVNKTLPAAQFRSSWKTS